MGWENTFYDSTFFEKASTVRSSILHNHRRPIPTSIGNQARSFTRLAPTRVEIFPNAKR